MMRLSRSACRPRGGATRIPRKNWNRWVSDSIKKPLAITAQKELHDRRPGYGRNGYLLHIRNMSRRLTDRGELATMPTPPPPADATPDSGEGAQHECRYRQRHGSRASAC